MVLTTKDGNQNLDIVRQEAIHYIHCPLLESVKNKG